MPNFEGEVTSLKVASTESKLTSNGAKLIKFTDTNGKKYSFFQTVGVWENGQRTGERESKAYEVWKSLGDPVGQVLKVGYKEEDGEYEGKKFTRNSVKFLEKLDNTVLDPRLNPNGSGKPGMGSLGEDLPF